MILVRKSNSNFERESLISPFGFKGGYVSELWQSVVRLESDNGAYGVGLGTQSVLWSDADVFAAHSEAAGNSLMFLMTAYAAETVCGIPFETPMHLMNRLLPMVYNYGKQITGNNTLRLTFALNSLVAVENAAWQLYARENNITDFDSMIRESRCSAFTHKHHQIAAIPLITYGVSMDNISRAIDEGYFFLKIKIGSDPDKDGDPDKMLAWDMNRLSEIHSIAKDRETEYTDNRYIPYYLDANGRYDSKDRLMRLIDYADRIGALERIILLEEPFPEEYDIDVSGIPVRIAADESAHTNRDALERIQMGYGAIALKPAAKTLSMSLKIADTAFKHSIPCFCADLTVNPILVDWNKNVAARLAPLPGMKIGVLETNGYQNYSNWEKMKTYHPRHNASWTRVVDGLFNLDDDFYNSSGGILLPSEHYDALSSGHQLACDRFLDREEETSRD